MNDWAAYGGLALAAFGAATILPLASEPLLIGLLVAGTGEPWLLVLIATAGNVAGSCVNWVLGRSVERFRDRRWFPVSGPQLARAEAWYRRWGRWSLLLSWAPLIGDPLTVIAGVLRENLWVFLVLVSLAKAARYITLALITLQIA